MPSKKPAVASTLPPATTADELNIDSPYSPFPIICVGASAGGLEACEALFSALPENCGMSFVVVVHLAPAHVSLMSELLQKNSKLPVCQITDGLQIKINNIYVIPPNKELNILQGKLYLTDLQTPRQSHLPIDTFLRSLAKAQGSQSIAIILSGTGSDGTLGLKAIKEACGMVMVQSAETAKYDGMPRSAMNTGLVDFELPITAMPKQLLSYTQCAKNVSDSRLSSEKPATLMALQKIFVILLNQTDKDFSLYKKNTLIRRIERRMNLHQTESIEDYVSFLQSSREEVGALFKELLIGVTNFFRDPEAFLQLKTVALPKLLNSKSDGQVIRVWVPGCSTGEEAYSIAILFKECMEQLNRYFSVQIFATDLDERAITTARAGLYPASIKEDVDPERLQHFFTKEASGHYRIRKSIRDMLIFASQDLIKDPPFTKLDLLSCRNLLIYFGAELQKKLLPLFFYSINPDGLLFLGSSESLGQSSELFTPIDKKWKIFVRQTSSQNPSILEVPCSFNNFTRHREAPVTDNIAADVSAMQLVEAILSEVDTPPCAIINDENNIIYIHGRTGRYLEPAEGRPSTNILEMARHGIKTELALVIHKVRATNKSQVSPNLLIQENDANFCLDLTVKPIQNKSPLQGLKMVIFKEASPVPPAATPRKKRGHATSSAMLTSREAALTQELMYIKESLQTTIEELETSNEELKSTNEELQSTNEELQSTNEEMETSKEELQSLNEESTTVNTELQSRIDELSAANDDMKNLLDSTDVATIFLDIDLCVRRFTPRANTIIPLVTLDVGRPIQHFALNLIDVKLVEIAQQVLDDLVVREQEVWSKDGLTYQMRIRPYRTLSNVIDGVVITFDDISLLKQAQNSLQDSLGLFRSLAHIAPMGVFQAEPSGKCLFVNQYWCEITGLNTEQAKSLEHVLNAHQADRQRVTKAWHEMVQQQTELNLNYRLASVLGDAIEVHVQASVVDQMNKSVAIVGMLAVV